MSSIVYQTNKKTGVTYAYRSESYRDPETKKPKSKRTYLGRVDPETKVIIPKAEDGKRNRSSVKAESAATPSYVKARISGLEQEVAELKDRNAVLQQRLKEKEKLIGRLRKVLEEA